MPPHSEIDPGTASRDAYETWHAGMGADAGGGPWHEMLKPELMALGLGGRRILEIGCGRGGFACWLASQQPKPAEVRAADFSPAAVAQGKEHAEKNGISGITWSVGDIQAIDQPDNSFDIVISCETIEHVPDPALAVRELARVLKKGGTLFLTTPSYLNLMGLYRGYLRLIGRRFTEVGQPINNFMLLPWTRGMVRMAGCRIQKTEAVVHCLPFPGRPPLRFKFLDKAGFLTRWAGLHSMVVAVKQK